MSESFALQKYSGPISLGHVGFARLLATSVVVPLNTGPDWNRHLANTALLYMSRAIVALNVTSSRARSFSSGVAGVGTFKRFQ